MNVINVNPNLKLNGNKMKSEAKKGEGLRYNTNKPRYDLLHPTAMAGIVKVLTAGANKYAERNWEAGMSWTTVLASMKRHIAAFERGEDYDPETGELHIDHVQCNAHFLSAYYKTYPQGDDRPHSYLNPNKIGLDIDEVLADFVGGMMKKFPDMKDRPTYWNDPHIAQHFSKVIDDNDFWLGLEPKVTDIPFEPYCYITSRPISTGLTKMWLDKHGFPVAPIYTVGAKTKDGTLKQMSKVEVAKHTGIDIFVDDAYHNFVELNKAGICTYLMDADHNQRYDVGHKRLMDLKDLV